MEPSTDPDAIPTPKRSLIWLSDKTTWFSLGVVIMLVGTSITVTSYTKGIDQQFQKSDWKYDQTLQRLAELSEQRALFITRDELRAYRDSVSHWASLLKAQLPAELRNSVPEPPR